MTDKGLDLDEKGMVILCPVVGWTTAPVAEMACLCRLEFVRSEDQLQKGQPEAVQFVMTPKQATELAESLLRTVSRIDLSGPPGTQKN